jgi:C-terminal domain of the ECSIT protein
VTSSHQFLFLQTKELKGCIDQTYVVSAQSPVQRNLIAEHPIDRPVFVEGGFTVWLRSKSLTYFTLQAEPTGRFLQFSKSAKENKDNVESKGLFK